MTCRRSFARKRKDGPQHIDADYVWSSIPITVLARAMGERVHAEVRQAAGQISYRAMLLIYLDLPVDRLTEYDAHYFPGADIRITRLSEPKHYPDRTELKGRTTLCAELPCDLDDATWKLSDAALGELVAQDLARAGLQLPTAPSAVYTRRLRQAYPIYLNGYEVPFGVLDRWAEGLPRLLSYGRQGLFAHDNTHHALFMAYCATDCVDGERFDWARWAAFREVFRTHVVED